MVDTPGRSGFGAQSVPTRRNRRARWKDGRLVLGILLVAITALAGAKLLSAADETTAIWAAERDLPAGTKLTEDDLTTVRVRFTSENEAARYVAAEGKLDGLITNRPISAQEFVPREAAVTAEQSVRTELPLSVATGRLPADVAVGDLVDVWVTPKAPELPAKLWWSKLRVIQVEAVKGVAGGSARRQILVALQPADLQRLPAALAAMGNGEPVLVRRGS